MYLYLYVCLNVYVYVFVMYVIIIKEIAVMNMKYIKWEKYGKVCREEKEGEMI